MSTRLLVRCIRLLGSNSLGVSALPAACRLPLTTSAPPLAAVTLRLHTSTSGGRSEGQRLAQIQAQAQEEGFLRKPERTELDDLIDGAGSVEELLQVWAERGGTGNQAATVLIQLARLSTTPESKTNTAEILQDRRFQQLLQTVDTQISLVWNGTLVNLLRSLSQLGVSPGEPAVRCVQNEAHWRLRRLSYRHLVSLADSCAGQARDEQQRVLLSDVVKQLELRWTEISEPRNVALLMGKLGHLSGALMDRLEDKHVLVHSEKYSIPQMCNLVLAFARLNYQPIKGDAFYSKVHEKLDSALGQLDPYMHTDVVWSLCVLQQARPSYLQCVLEPDFYKKLTGSGGSSSRDENYMLKLLHINTTATLECPEYRGPALPAEACMYPGERKASALQSGLREALRGLVGEQQGLYHSALSTVYGWTIDGELVLNSESKPVPLKDLAAPHLPQAGGATPLPPGAKRLALNERLLVGSDCIVTVQNRTPKRTVALIALLACEFPHYNSRSKDLLGRFVMQRRHLQLAGFLTVDVPYYEWLELKSDWQKMAYLKDKMGKAVAEDMAK
ncbi:Protein TBRG4 [Acipenser ruthenus]|uniref:FAST kinase domain-containing protein 4 n=1 Tax=Acipenser ruthenus TaxID=7906 RepID=A0A662YZT3_ACIRT|nr:Protein TBRG4 [Acipenser ruthenus]